MDLMEFVVQLLYKVSRYRLCFLHSNSTLSYNLLNRINSITFQSSEPIGHFDQNFVADHHQSGIRWKHEPSCNVSCRNHLRFWGLLFQTELPDCSRGGEKLIFRHFDQFRQILHASDIAHVLIPMLSTCKAQIAMLINWRVHIAMLSIVRKAQY